jgi:hypothetical protein
MRGRRAIEADWRNVEDVKEAAKRSLEESTHLALKCPKGIRQIGAPYRGLVAADRRPPAASSSCRPGGRARLNWRSDHVTGNGTTLAIS